MLGQSVLQNQLVQAGVGASPSTDANVRFPACCVFDYIEFLYNPSRKHARNGMPPPVNFKTDRTT